MNEPLFPTSTRQVYATEVKTKKKLKNVTWTLGDKPCKTLKKSAGSWTDVTHG
jgi:hypothetical protein